MMVFSDEKKEWPDTLWDISDIAVGTVLRDWFDEGIRIMVIRGPFHPCVYFGIPEDHPLAGHGYDDLPIRVHGGLTFGAVGDGRCRPKGYYWYGYDYGHCDDFMFSKEALIQEFSEEFGKKWTLGEIVKDSWEGLYDLKRLMKLAEQIRSKALSALQGSGMGL